MALLFCILYYNRHFDFDLVHEFSSLHNFHHGIMAKKYIIIGIYRYIHQVYLVIFPIFVWLQLIFFSNAFFQQHFNCILYQMQQKIWYKWYSDLSCSQRLFIHHTTLHTVTHCEFYLVFHLSNILIICCITKYASILIS